MPTLHLLGLVVPAKRGKNQLIRGHRATDEDGHLGERAQRFIRQQFPDRAPGGTIERESEGAFLRIIRRKEEHAPAEIGVQQTGVRDEQ